jgi:hypothetical protein
MIVFFHGEAYEDMCKAKQRPIDYVKEKEDAGECRCGVDNDIDYRRPRLVEDDSGFRVYILSQEEYL